MEDRMIHTKSSGGVVVNDEGKVLVVNQKRTSWSLPKGHIEKGEDDITAAKREIYEESGVRDLELIKKLGTYNRYKIGEDGSEDKSEYKEINMYLFRTNTVNSRPIDPENPEIRWLNKEKVADLLTHPKDKEFYLGIKNQF